MKQALVLEGGGVLGASQAVLLKYLRDSNAPTDFSVFAGTSIGALNCAVLALGYDANHLLRMWMDIKEVDIMPRKWYSVLRHMRHNLADKYVVEKLLRPKGLPDDYTLKQLYNDTGKELITTATSLQTNKTILFAHDWKDMPIAQAVKYSISHPVVFDNNPLEINGRIHDLTDGGVAMNCPVVPLITRADIEHVTCLAVTVPDNASKKRYIDFIPSMKRIMEGIVLRNEFFSYTLARNRWGKDFRLYVCRMEQDIDIFDVSQVRNIMATAYAKTSTAEENGDMDSIIEPRMEAMIDSQRVAPVDLKKFYYGKV